MLPDISPIAPTAQPAPDPRRYRAPPHRPRGSGTRRKAAASGPEFPPSRKVPSASASGSSPPPSHCQPCGTTDRSQAASSPPQQPNHPVLLAKNYPPCQRARKSRSHGSPPLPATRPRSPHESHRRSAALPATPRAPLGLPRHFHSQA